MRRDARSGSGYARLARAVLRDAIEDARLPTLLGPQDTPYPRLSGWRQIEAAQARAFLTNPDDPLVYLWCAWAERSSTALAERTRALIAEEPTPPYA
jgi:hypothetical protein